MEKQTNKRYLSRVLSWNRHVSSSKLQCVICHLKMINSSMVPSKPKRPLEAKRAL